jgi:F0F1-type ATP synthase membrane subunit b/b'
MMLAIMVSIGSAIERTGSFLDIFNSVLIFGIVVLVVRYFVRERVKKFFDESASRLKSKSTHLRELNQELIDRLRDGIKKHKGKPRDYKLILFNSDYEGIQILKKPSAWREHFVAIASD